MCSYGKDDKGVSVNDCPIKLEVCYPSCYWWDRKNKRCAFPPAGYDTQEAKVKRKEK